MDTFTTDWSYEVNWLVPPTLKELGVLTMPTHNILCFHPKFLSLDETLVWVKLDSGLIFKLGFKLKRSLMISFSDHVF